MVYVSFSFASLYFQMAVFCFHVYGTADYTNTSDEAAIYANINDYCSKSPPTYYEISLNGRCTVYGSTVGAIDSVGTVTKCGFAIGAPSGYHIQATFNDLMCNDWPRGSSLQVWDGYNFERTAAYPTTGLRLIMMVPQINGVRSSCSADLYSITNVMSFVVSHPSSAQFLNFTIDVLVTSSPKKVDSPPDNRLSYLAFLALIFVFITMGALARMFCFDTDCPCFAGRTTIFQRFCYCICNCEYGERKAPGVLLPQQSITNRSPVYTINERLSNNANGQLSSVLVEVNEDSAGKEQRRHTTALLLDVTDISRNQITIHRRPSNQCTFISAIAEERAVSYFQRAVDIDDRNRSIPDDANVTQIMEALVRLPIAVKQSDLRRTSSSKAIKRNNSF